MSLLKLLLWIAIRLRGLLSFRGKSVRGRLVASMAGWVVFGSVGAEPDTSYTPIFNGRDLTGWAGDEQVWTVSNGVLTGHVPPGKKPEQYLIWSDGIALEDFELRFQFRLERGNAGILYRGESVGSDGVLAYEYSQIDRARFKNGETANIHEIGVGPEKPGRSRLANWGQLVVIDPSGNKISAGTTPIAPAVIRERSQGRDWQEGMIRAQGNRLTHWMNGEMVGEVTDLQASRSRSSGSLRLRVVGNMGDTMIRYRDIRLRTLSSASGVAAVPVRTTRSSSHPSAPDRVAASSEASSKPPLDWIVPDLPKAGSDGWVKVFDGERVYGLNPTNKNLIAGNLFKKNNLLVLDSSAGWGGGLRLPWKGTNAAVRLRGRNVSSQNLGIGIGGTYVSWCNGDASAVCGIGQSVRGVYKDLRTGPSGTKPDEFFDMEFRIEGADLTLAIDGQIKVRAKAPWVDELRAVSISGLNGIAVVEKIEVRNP